MKPSTLRRVSLALGLLSACAQLGCAGPSAALAEREEGEEIVLDAGRRDAGAHDGGASIPVSRESDAGRRPTLSCEKDAECTRFTRIGLTHCHPFLDRCVRCVRQSDCDDGEFCELDGECDRLFD